MSPARSVPTLRNAQSGILLLRAVARGEPSALEIPAVTVRARLHRARRALHDTRKGERAP